MNDETKDDIMERAREWLQSCVNAATRSGMPEEADLEAFLLAHLDGEPARTQAACDRRAEEVREACAQRLVGNLATRGDAIDAVRATPLTATPLADENAALRARVAELEKALLDACREKFLRGHVTTLLFDSLRLKVPGVEHYESWGEERKSRLQQAEADVRKAVEALRDLVASDPEADLMGYADADERARAVLAKHPGEKKERG